MCLHHTASTDHFTLSLHDALPICLLAALAVALLDQVGRQEHLLQVGHPAPHLLLDLVADDGEPLRRQAVLELQDRKSTRLNSSHQIISYAVFFLKKKISIVDHSHI